MSGQRGLFDDVPGYEAECEIETDGPLVAPFPWFGGKRRIAPLIWRAFGDVANYVEPFFGSGATLLARPGGASGIETVNDLDGMVANFWRALQREPNAVAGHADYPVHENDLHARHAWLVGQIESLRTRLEGDPEFYDAKIAGWWAWGIACWIGSGFCSGDGPWQVVAGKLVHLGSAGQGVHRQLVHLGDAGQGVHRQLVHLGDAGRGVHRKRVHLGDAGQGQDASGAARGGLLEWFHALAERLRYVRVCSGDWSRVCGPTPTHKQGLTGVFLDPPYADTAERTDNLYREDSNDVAHAVREWAIENGQRDDMRIALCGYEGEHQMPPTWSVVAWKAKGGYGSQSLTHDNPNAKRERVWFSPACRRVA